MRQAGNSKKSKLLMGVAQALILGAGLVGGSGAWADCPFDYQEARTEDYNINGAEVALKKEGPTWQRCAVGQTFDGKTCQGAPTPMTYAQAQAAAKNGWRLPTKGELEKIKMEGCLYPAVNTILFLNLEGRKYWYWSATDANSDGVWALHPESGVVKGTNKADYAAVLLVK